MEKFLKGFVGKNPGEILELRLCAGRILGGIYKIIYRICAKGILEIILERIFEGTPARIHGRTRNEEVLKEYLEEILR